LIILEARYGHLTSGDSPTTILDVTVPLQALVKDSSLTISTTVSKCNLTGFYDPCVGEEKSLQIKYSFRSQIHTVSYNDTDPIVLPNRGRSHKMHCSIEVHVSSPLLDHIVP
jgi:DnaJ homolog subfamily C member 11